jgi:hypothetical protein
MRMYRLPGFLIAAAVWLSFSAPQAALAGRLVVTCIHNTTDRSLPYSFQWGAEGWQKSVVVAQGYRWHSYPYDEDNRSAPSLKVSFDADPYTDGSQVKTYTLQRTISTADNCESGTQYNFRDTDSGALDLYIATRDQTAGSQAPLKYALACIENRTGFYVPYIVQWGSGDWKSWNLNAGRSNWHSGPYRQGQAVPVLRIKFDYDQETEGSQVRQYTLTTYSSPTQSCEGGKKYYFGKRSDGGFDLFDPEKSGQPVQIGVDASPER